MLAVLLMPALLLTSCFFGSDIWGVSNTRHSAEEDFQVTVVHVNGEIEILSLNGDLDVVSTNGEARIDLSIPFNTSAQFSAGVTNGSISMGSGFTLANVQTTPTSLSGRLGTSLGTIRLRTTNGTIEVTGF